MRDKNEPQQHPANLIDALLAHLGLHKDSVLAEKLGMAPPQISKMRHGRTPVNSGHLLRMYDVTGLTIEQLRKYLYKS
jgi:DNA-binding transcriptional regulator YdaS (Cro superfamily)